MTKTADAPPAAQRADRAPRRARPLTQKQALALVKIERAPYAPEANVPGECPTCGSTARMVRKDSPASPNGECHDGWHLYESHHPDPHPAGCRCACHLTGGDKPGHVCDPEEPQEGTSEAATAPEGTDTPPDPAPAPQRPVGALALRDGQTEWTGAQLEVLRTLIQQDQVPSPPVLKMFLNNCQRTGLDPFAKQIYLVGRRNKRGEIVWATQTGIDGFRVVSQRSNEYAGMTPTQWCGEDGVWVDVWLKADHPAAARVGVYRRGFVEPLVAVATWKSYYPGERQGQMWLKMPDVMLAKVAEALARRMAFPQDLSGLYTAEEMEQAEDYSTPQTIASQVVEPSEPETPADPAEVEKAMRHAMSLAVLNDRAGLSAYWRELKGTPVHRATVEFQGGTGTLADLIVWLGTQPEGTAAEAASDWIDENPDPATVDTVTGEVVTEDAVVVEDPPAWDGPTSTDPAMAAHVAGGA